MPSDPNRQRVAIRYVAEDGNEYRVVTSRNHAAAVGAVAPAANAPPLPTKWKPRHINGTQILPGHDRNVRVIAPNKFAGVWTGATNLINVAPFGNIPITGRSGERRTQGAPPYDGNQNPPNERVSINYISDNGTAYTYVTTRSHAFAVNAIAPTGGPLFPKIWTARHVDVINPDLTGRDQRKVLVAPDPQAAYYLANTGYAFNVAGVTYNSTGRIEEDRPNGAPDYIP